MKSETKKMLALEDCKSKVPELEKYLKSASYVYSIFGIGDIIVRGENYLKLTLLVRLFQVTIMFFHLTFEFPAYSDNMGGSICKLVTFIFNWADIMKILCVYFRGLLRPNGVKNLIEDIVKMEKNIREINGNKNSRSVWLYRGLFFANSWVPIIICASHVIDWIGKPEITVIEILQIFNRFGLMLMHSSFCTFALVIYLQLRDANDQYRKLKSSHLSLAQRVYVLKMAVWRHDLITKVWNQLIDFYEPYLFFEMLSVTAATLSGLYLIYNFLTPGKISSKDALPFREILLAIEIGYEIVIICKLCSTVINESYKRGIISDEATLKTTPLFLLESPCGFKDVKLQRLSCKLYGYFTLNNGLLMMVLSCLFCYSVLLLLRP